MAGTKSITNYIINDITMNGRNHELHYKWNHNEWQEPKVSRITL